MMPDVWQAVDSYLERYNSIDDAGFQTALRRNRAAKLPEIDVSPLQGKFLGLLVTISRAKRVLEIGTLGGYSTLWMAKALDDIGKIVTLELEPEHAKVAVANFRAARLEHQIDLRLGHAPDTLNEMLRSDEAPFDMVFIDADKPNNPAYFDFAVRLTVPGSLLVFDNVIREGEIVNQDNNDPRVLGTRKLHEMIQNSNEVDATTLQTVGRKGYDGLTIAIRV